MYFLELYDTTGFYTVGLTVHFNMTQSVVKHYRK